MTEPHMPQPERGRLVSDHRAVRGGLATNAGTPEQREMLGEGANGVGGTPETAASREQVLSEVQRDGLQLLGDLYSDRPAVEASQALALLLDLLEPLTTCALTPQPDWRMHRELLRMARMCVEAAEKLEARLDDEARPFSWSSRHVAAHDRLEKIERRLNEAERRLKADAARREREQ